MLPRQKADVTIVDADGKPVADAKVEFKVYNYAEFYTVASKQTDADGKTFLTAGKGDMLVWASKDGKFGYAKLSFGKDHELVVKMDKTAGDGHAVDFELVLPPKMRSCRRLRPNSVRRMTAAWSMKIPSATLMCLCS